MQGDPFPHTGGLDGVDDVLSFEREVAFKTQDNCRLFDAADLSYFSDVVYDELVRFSNV